MLGGLAGALAGTFTSQGGGQVLPDVLPLSLLDVVLGGIFQVRLHLQEQNIISASVNICRSYFGMNNAVEIRAFIVLLNLVKSFSCFTKC